jgi:hypothetical protein
MPTTTHFAVASARPAATPLPLVAAPGITADEAKDAAALLVMLAVETATLTPITRC